MNKETIKYFHDIFKLNKNITLLEEEQSNIVYINNNIELTFDNISANGYLIEKDWIKYYNSNDNSGLSKSIKSFLKDCLLSEDVYFICSKKLIIKTDLKTFLENIFLFLQFDDDSPIVLVQDIGYLVLNPIGTIIGLDNR